MDDLWVCNSSPIICLAKVGLVSLLSDLPAGLIIPQEVANEVLAGPAEDAGRVWISTMPLDFLTGRLEPLHTIAAWDLGAGETQVIQAAVARRGAVAIIDDLAARNCAVAHGLPVVGTLGVVLRAKAAGHIDYVAPVLARLREVGLRVDERLEKRVLQLAGETL